MLGAGQIDTIDGMTCVNPYQFDVYLDAQRDISTAKGRTAPFLDPHARRDHHRRRRACP